MKAIICLAICLISITAFSHVESTKNMGGYELIMTRETQKMAMRLVQYLDSDLKEVNTILDQIVYTRVNGQKTKNQKIVIQDDKKKQLNELSIRMTDNFNNLNTVFKSIYFVGDVGKDYSKKFDSIKSYQRDLKIFAESNDNATLASIAEQGAGAKSNMQEIMSFIKYAQIKTEEFIKQKRQTMSVWDWLFGY